MRSTRVDDSCPYCKDRKLLRGYNDLATAYPELVAEWDFERNGDLGPDGIVSGSARRVWWRCGRGHAWQISAYNRTGGADRGCPYCGDRKVLIGFNGLRTTHSRIAGGVGQGAQRRPKADRRDRQLQQARLVEVQGGPRVVRPHSEPRRKGKADPGCPYCSGRKVLAGYNDLAASIPS